MHYRYLLLAAHAIERKMKAIFSERKDRRFFSGKECPPFCICIVSSRISAEGVRRIVLRINTDGGEENIRLIGKSRLQCKHFLSQARTYTRAVSEYQIGYQNMPATFI